MAKARALSARGREWFIGAFLTLSVGACSGRSRDFTVGAASGGSSNEAGSNTGASMTGGAAGASGAAGSVSEAGKNEEGLGCASDGDCQSGHCRDEVCCATKCDGACEACAESLTGRPSGSCEPVVAGLDPHDDCEAERAESCGTDGSCDGEGACRLYGQDQVCRAAACADSTYTPASTCDGQRRCQQEDAMSCGQYPCSADGCETPCTKNTDCPPDAYCATDVCKNQKTVGVTCATTEECRSGSCVDGVCCESACDLSCQACSSSTTGLSDGTCGARKSSATKPCKSGNTTSCVDTLTSVSHCGTCGNECEGSSLPGATPACSGGTCSVSCPAGTLGDGVNVCVPVTTVAAGPDFACGLLTDGHVKCWGNQSLGLSPSGLSNVLFKSISAGKDFMCGIRDNGLAYCWGAAAPTVKAGTFHALAVGDVHVCGIKANRTLDCWTKGIDETVSSPPSGTYRWVASGADYSCAIVQGGNSNGRGSCWGTGTMNYGDFPSTTTAKTFTQMYGAGVGGWGVQPDGSIVGWAKNFFSPPSGTIVKALAPGQTQNRCGILMDNTLVCWGTPGAEAVIPPSGKFTAIAMGGNFGCGVKVGGSLTCWGENDKGQAPSAVSGTFQGYW